MTTNPELELARSYVGQTDRHVFLTGKAGTGKTTFLHRIREEVPKRKVVVAPTGVAAINAKGVTIHSQFQLPFGVLYPERLKSELRTHRLGRDKANVLRSLDLLVIDEISMVRADVLDAISAVLQKYRRDSRPFGGVQLLMIGDLHQLPPVVRDEEWAQLRADYRTPYFFGSLALAEAGVIPIQLRHIYRQSDANFIDLLNKVRHDQLDADTLRLLNSRYEGPGFEPAEGEEYITLTSHNRTANAINQRHLNRLTTPLHTFRATIDGQFPASMYPNDPELEFRVGAQVMYNKNDVGSQSYYNGKLGRITEIEGDRIRVLTPGEEPIDVTPVSWENRKYELNPQSKEVTDEVIGTFTQHPLRLAWAITIHKSQGLTFERVIIDAADAFAHGQVYVALSRCKTFEGIVLRSRIGNGSVRTDRVVQEYSARTEEQFPTASDLHADRLAYQYNCLRDLFDFDPLAGELAWLERTLLENEAAIQGDGREAVRQIREKLDQDVARVSRGFLAQLAGYQGSGELPGEHAELDSRLRKSAAYFLPHLKEMLERLAALPFMSDNQKVYTAVTDRLKACGLTLTVKIKAVESLTGGFDPDRYQRSKADAALDYEKRPAKPARYATPAAGGQSPSELYLRLAQWRTDRAAEEGVPPYRIIHNAALLNIAEQVPADVRSLQSLPGIGAKTVARYGAELIDIVEAYLTEADDLETDLARYTAPPKKQRSGPNTYQQSLRRFLAGESVASIAADRELTEGTIYGHLVKMVAEGNLEAERILPTERLEPLVAYLADRPADQTLREIYEHFAEAYAYHEIRLGLAIVDRGKTDAVGA